jgi:hypothetical protein
MGFSASNDKVWFVELRFDANGTMGMLMGFCGSMKEMGSHKELGSHHISQKLKWRQPFVSHYNPYIIPI